MLDYTVTVKLNTPVMDQYCNVKLPNSVPYTGYPIAGEGGGGGVKERLPPVINDPTNKRILGSFPLPKASFPMSSVLVSGGGTSASDTAMTKSKRFCKSPWAWCLAPKL